MLPITARYSGLLLGSTAAIAIAIISPACAKSLDHIDTGTANAAPTQPGEASPEPVATAPESSADGQGTGLGDIIVTATKRETNLQKTPISISVISTQGIEDRHIQSLYNLTDGSIPSLRVATFEARQSALTIGIRGIVPYDQNQTARDGGVSVYIDGVALGKTQGLNAALFDVERMEVLKGPQGTLFGRNTEGGALSIVTKAPTGVLGGHMEAGIGNFGSRSADAHIDLPAFANIALKFEGVYQHQDPTVQDPLSGSTGWNYYDRKGGRAAARWQPFDGLTADFAYDYAKDENTPNYSQLVSYNPNGYNVGTYTSPAGVVGTSLFYNGTACNVAVPATGGVTNPCIAPKAPIVGVHTGRQTVADVGVPQQPSVDITHGVSGNIKYKLAPWIELRSITAWRGVETDQWDNSGGPERAPFSPSTTATNGYFSRYSLSYLRQHQFSQELQAVGNIANQLDYVVGAYYYTEHATEYAATPLSNQWNIDGTAYTIRSPIYAGTVNSGNNSGAQQFNSACNNLLSTSTGSYSQGSAVATQFANSCQYISRASEAYDHNFSLFGNATYTPAGLDMLHVTAGGRWTKDRRRGQLYVVNNNYVGGVFQPGFVPFTFRNSISRFDPMVNVAFDASNDVHLYAKYATGFRAGGANDRSQQFNPFGPETVKSYEVGAKMDFWEHRARLNVAGYIMNRKNTQFDFDLYDTVPTSPTFGSHIEQTQNAGNTKIRGVEVDLTVKPVQALTLSASYAYTYWKAPAAVNPITGGPAQQLYIVYTPKNAASGAIDYVLPVNVFDGANLRFHIDGNYSGKQYSFQLENTQTDSSFVVNGRIALADIQVGGSSKVTLSIWSRNLFDTTYYYRRSAANSVPVLNYGANGALASTSYSGILGDYANLNPPRTFGGEVSVKF